ncbi:SAM-dependent methyltransferase [Mycobacterium sp. 141]|uniref:SAM-dependent methyltransferase n=1 Tax=Mycobacterium sp. 141 TaxID=1120797 RepID=UPI00035EE223|nr:SAM-dependent methyltransferase [Mycobacterium sp. 141]
MSRTDDDTWDINESVGATALGVAIARAHETASDSPLFLDPYAQMFLDAAAERGWARPQGAMAERIRTITDYAASRTKWFDEFFIAAGANGVRQTVILASGLDARAWRLPWIDGSVVYEIDQPKVLQFKTDVLQSHHARPAAAHVAVPVDLRRDWPSALRQAGFDPSQPTAWSAEGLLPYLPAATQDLLFERVTDLSARDSRIAVEGFSVDFFTEEYLARRRARLQQLREQAGTADENMPDPAQLWYLEQRADVATWLRDHRWRVSSIGADELMAHYHRVPPDDSDDGGVPSVFVEGVLAERPEG